MSSFSKMILFVTLSCFSLVGSSQTTFSARYGDRVYVSNFLLSIFGEAGKNIIEESIFKKPHVFGGSCDPYSQELKISKTKPFKIVGGNEKCVKNFFSEYVTPVFTGNTALRSAALTGACRELVNCSDCLSNAYLKAEVKNSEEKSEENFYKIFSLFYPFSKKEHFENYMKALRNSSAGKKELSFYISLFCQSEDWQLL